MFYQFQEDREADNHVYKELLYFRTKGLSLKTVKYLSLIARNRQRQALQNQEVSPFLS
jgi:hypothetical protein